MTLVLNIPGLWNSGPDHWQTHWEKGRSNTRRVQQRDWETPRRSDWIDSIRAALRAVDEPVVLAAHSLGCSTVAHLARDASAEELAKIRGALLVAPSDCEAPSYPKGPQGFTPMPLQRLPFPAIVAFSTNDEYVSVDRARAFASAWGARAVDVGALGHINSSSKLGMWPVGEALLHDLMA